MLKFRELFKADFAKENMKEKKEVIVFRGMICDVINLYEEF